VRRSHYNSTDRRIAEEAAHWLIELEDSSSPDLSGFAAWLTASPRHIEEFLFASALWNSFGEFDEQRRIDVEQLIARARANVQPLEIDGRHAALRVRPPRGLGRLLAAAALAVAVALGVWTSIVRYGATYTTDIGEQRIVKLTDGSIVTLNTRSRAVVRFSADAREVELAEGEAFFDVEHDPDRPFRVKAGSAVVQAIGTQFNVHRLGATTVSVVEGAVEVALLEKSSTESVPSVRLSAGEQLEIDASGALAPPRAADIERVLAWRERRLIFRNEPLGQIASEFNRYNERPLIVEGSMTRSRRITGVFQADDPGALIAFLERDADLSVQVRDDRILIRGP
jgi:transmembrane sensor